MQVTDQALHPFVVWPKTAVGINAPDGCQNENDDERSDGFQNPRWPRPISRIAQGKNEPQDENHLDYNPEEKGLARDKWEKERATNDQRNNRQ